MYLTGTPSDFTNRLHQLPGLNIPTGAVVASGLASINLFLIEGRAYIASGFASAGVSGKWEQEARVQRFRLSGDASQMLRQQF